MRPLFRAWLTSAGHEIVQGILSPEEWRFSGPLALRATRFSAAWRNNTDALHSQKSLKGIEPGEMMP
jgi:hypothetical protein